MTTIQLALAVATAVVLTTAVRTTAVRAEPAPIIVTERTYVEAVRAQTGDAVDIAPDSIVAEGSLRTVYVRMRQAAGTTGKVWMRFDCATPRFQHVESVITDLETNVVTVVPLGEWTEIGEDAHVGRKLAEAVCTAPVQGAH